MGISTVGNTGRWREIVARYPTFPSELYDLSTEEIKEMYNTIQTWGAVLVNELDARDLELDATPSSNILAVVTVTSIGRPRKGDIVYAASAGKFRGYVSLGSETSWQDLN